MIDAVIAWCESSGLDFEISGNTCTVVLPGEHKLRTTCSLVAGEHSLSVNAFVARHPDENADAVHRWLLERNRRLARGEVAEQTKVSEQLLDQVLGAVLSEADGSFNIILELGFRSSIEKEWRWRLSRGESTANLAAFEHLRPGQG